MIFEKYHTFAVMETKHDIEKKIVRPVKIIYNDDEAIIDFIADLKDRPMLLAGMDELNERIKKDSLKNFMLLFKAKQDGLIILVICNPIYLDFDDNNRYILYAHPSLRQLCIYFGQYCQNIKCYDKKIIKEVEDIQRFLYYQWAKEDENNTQSDFLG